NRRTLRLPPTDRGAPRRPSPRLGPGAGRRRAPLDLAPRRRARLRQHAARQRAGARALPVVRVRGPPGRLVRARPLAVTAVRVTVGRALAALLVSASALVGVGAAAPAAVAQTGPATFTLAGQSPWIAPGSDFVMRLDATNVPAGAEVALTVHDAVDSRSKF